MSNPSAAPEARVSTTDRTYGKRSVPPDGLDGAGLPSPGRLDPWMGRAWVGMAVALGAPALATILASLLNSPGTSVAALLYFLAVVASASLGHVGRALLAASLSFLAVDYYFTAPINELFGRPRVDLVILAVFLVSAAAVSASVSRARRQQRLADLRGSQLEALSAFMLSMLLGSTLKDALPGLAASFRGAYLAHGCRIRLDNPRGSKVEGGDGDVAGEAAHIIPLSAGGEMLGRIELFGPSIVAQCPETAQVDAFAVQLGLALQRMELGEAAQSAQREAESSQARAALFSSVTHDLKTPLASIEASASSLLEEGLFSTDDRRDFVQTILAETERLERLVSNIMSLSRLRSGALIPSRESILVEDVVTSALRRLGKMLAGRAISVRSEDIPPVLADVVQLDQVVSNILENAARFSPQGSPVEITIGVAEGSIEVRVIDRGPGFPPNIQDEVFREFVRGDASGRPAGAGLGLAIAHAIVTAHHGSIWIEDTTGGGATVAFRLPQDASAHAEDRERRGA
jgi:two-component system, OmpR family, sensor histidine kinase KdpD